MSDSTSKLSALRTAVTNFADSVSEKAAGEDGIPGTEDDVNHRIAVVGYAYNSSGSYSNTEVFIGAINIDITADMDSPLRTFMTAHFKIWIRRKGGRM